MADTYRRRVSVSAFLAKGAPGKTIQLDELPSSDQQSTQKKRRLSIDTMRETVIKKFQKHVGLDLAKEIEIALWNRHQISSKPTLIVSSSEEIQHNDQTLPLPEITGEQHHDDINTTSQNEEVDEIEPKKTFDYLLTLIQVLPELNDSRHVQIVQEALDARRSALQEIDEHECTQAEEQTRESGDDVDMDVDVIEYILQTKETGQEQRKEDMSQKTGKPGEEQFNEDMSQKTGKPGEEQRKEDLSQKNMNRKPEQNERTTLERQVQYETQKNNSDAEIDVDAYKKHYLELMGSFRANRDKVYAVCSRTLSVVDLVNMDVKTLKPESLKEEIQQIQEEDRRQHVTDKPVTGFVRPPDMEHHVKEKKHANIMPEPVDKIDLPPTIEGPRKNPIDFCTIWSGSISWAPECNMSAELRRLGKETLFPKLPITETLRIGDSVDAEEFLEYFHAVSSSKSHPKILEYFQFVVPEDENVDEDLADALAYRFDQRGSEYRVLLCRPLSQLKLYFIPEQIVTANVDIFPVSVETIINDKDVIFSSLCIAIMDSEFHSQLMNPSESNNLESLEEVNSDPMKTITVKTEQQTIPVKRRHSSTSTNSANMHEISHYIPVSPSHVDEQFRYCSKFARSKSFSYASYRLWAGPVVWNSDNPKLMFTFHQIGGTKIDRLPINKILGFKLVGRASERELCDFLFDILIRGKSHNKEAVLLKYSVEGIDEELKSFDNHISWAGKSSRVLQSESIGDMKLYLIPTSCEVLSADFIQTNFRVNPDSDKICIGVLRQQSFIAACPEASNQWRAIRRE